MNILINKYLAKCNIGSRRKIDDLIKCNKILINSIPVQPGQIIDTTKDQIFYMGKLLQAATEKIYIAFNKPLNVLSSVSDNRGRKTIMDFIDLPYRLYPIGRLDFNSTGLILITNDGDLSLKLTHPRYHIPKTYLVKVDKDITYSFIKNMTEAKMLIENKKLNPTSITQINRRQFEMIIYQGIKRQIRQMCKYLGYEVISLQRIQIGDIKLGKLNEGKWRYLTDQEIRKLIS